MYTAALVTGRSFATACIPLLRTGHTAFFGYSGECLEALQHENRAGVRTIVDQVDPARTEYLIVQDEAARHPELALPSQPLPVEFSARLQQEWAEASHVVVNSEWSKRALLEQGVDSDKLVVLPLAYLPVGDGPPRRPRRGDPLKVLWLGTLSLRKGLAYAIEAARLLANAPVRFTFAGPLEVNPANLTFPKNATYIGHVARINAPLVFRRHDVFLFPTLSDGFGMTQLEAMAYGLPVIATRCCAQVVEPGVSGFLVHERTPREITDSILEFLNDPDLLSRMSAAALRRAEDFQPEKIWPILERVMQP
jgi:glycosyltransferase involved in cell wall biosynthesis